MSTREPTSWKNKRKAQ